MRLISLLCLFILGMKFGGFFGALLCVGLGVAYFARKQGGASFVTGANRQKLFFNSTFAVMGHVAKASGQVTQHDIRIATALMEQMRLSDAAKADAKASFREGKSASFDVKACLKTFRAISMGRKELLKMFLEIQIQTALSDGNIDQSERAVLQVIAQELGFTRRQLESLLERWQAEFNFHKNGRAGTKTTADDAYSVLGLTSSVSDQEVKRAYRKLMNEHHPDKLVAKGLPEEMMELAKRKAQDIQAAYDRVKTERGMR